MIEDTREGLRVLVFPSLERIGLTCAVSTVPLDVKDRTQRDRFVRAMGLDPAFLATVRQVHHADVVAVGAPTADPPPEADGLVTATPGLALFLRAADCSLVLVADPVHRAVGAVHAGWKGSARGVVVQMVRAMAACHGSRAEDCVAAVGPTIGPDRFPVGPEVPAAFLRTRDWARDFISARGTSLHFDLPGANARFLEEWGIPRSSIEVSTLCTYDSPGLLHSYRRDGAGGGHHGLVAAWPDTV